MPKPDPNTFAEPDESRVFARVGDGWACHGCLAELPQIDITDPAVETHTYYEHGFKEPIVCAFCSLSIPIYVESPERPVSHCRGHFCSPERGPAGCDCRCPSCAVATRLATKLP